MSAHLPPFNPPRRSWRMNSSSNWENLGGSFLAPDIRIHHVFDQRREVVHRSPTEPLSSLGRITLELCHVPRTLLRFDDLVGRIPRDVLLGLFDELQDRVTLSGGNHEVIRLVLEHQ